MKTYTADERISARKKLPKPVSDFLVSTAITEVYMGIMQKHSLNLRQIGILSEIINITVEGLEPQSSVEANLHQALPELSNASMRELILDINDRVFKEATRRLKENITEPDTWDVATLGAKPSEEELHREALRRNQEEKLDDDPNIIATDEAELEKTVSEQQVELATLQREIAEYDAKLTADDVELERKMLAQMGKDVETLSPEELATRYPRPGSNTQPRLDMKEPIRPRGEAPVLSEKTPTFIKRASVIEAKLAAPAVQKTEEAVIPLSEAPKAETPAPAKLNPIQKSDPYRESVD